jgi:DNA primase small subunit
LADQDCFASQEGWEALLQLIPEPTADILRKKWSAVSERSSDDKWADIKNEVKKFDKGSSQRVGFILTLFWAG